MQHSEKEAERKDLLPLLRDILTVLEQLLKISREKTKKGILKAKQCTYFVNSAKPSTQDYSCLKCLDWHHLCPESSPTSSQPALMDELDSQL